MLENTDRIEFRCSKYLVDENKHRQRQKPYMTTIPEWKN